MTKVSYRKRFVCGWCRSLADVERGAAIIKQHPGGKPERLVGDAARQYLAERCRCDARGPARNEVSEIARDGAWNLRPGMRVAVQLRRKPGTRRTEGEVIACYDDDTLDVDFGSPLGTRSVRVDEFVFALRSKAGAS